MYVIYGKGQVGTSTKNLLDKMGIHNILMDDSDIDMEVLKETDQIIVSPGVPQNHQIYQLRKNKITGEFDVCWQILTKLGIINNFEFIGITGTDGKSTTTWIVQSLFQNIIDPVKKTTTHIGGNFEPTLAQIILDILEEGKKDQQHICILEISSFMAYNINKFMFDYSIFINFERDHLNWHSDMDDYFNAKMNIIRNTKYKSIVSDKVLTNIKAKSGLNIVTPKCHIDMSKTNFVGEHNLQNISLAYTLIENYIDDNGLNITEDQILKGIYEIKPLDHRTQFVRQIGEISIYDDGKSTTANSLKAGINSFEEKIILIAGGSDKGDDFGLLQNDFKNKLNGAILLGQTSPKIAAVLDKADIPYQIATNMVEAVNLAYQKAQQTNTSKILFSPGCASFDLFKNRLDRVNQFLEAVKNLS